MTAPMLQAMTHDSSYPSWSHEVIDLTADDEPPAIQTNGVWPSPAQEQRWEEPARKRRRVDEEETRDEEFLEEPVLPQSQPTKTRIEPKLPPPKKTIEGHKDVVPAATPHALPAKSANAETDDDATQPRRPPPTKWFKLHHRPYVNVDDRKLYRDAIENKGLASLGPGTISHLPLTYHVDFSDEEIEYVWQEAQALVVLPKVPRDPIRGIKKVLRKDPNIAITLPKRIQGTGPVAARDELDLYYFLSDVNYEKISRDPKVYSFRQQEPSNTAEDARARRVAALRFRRELEGQSPFGRGRVFGGIKHDILRTREDGLEVRAVWTNCAGDIATLTWVSESAFVCGTTEHSDAHNQQYNRPGNLLLGSTEAGTLRAYPDHRIQRPRVAKGENASEAMRQSQDPWLYSSVVSSAYDSKLDIAYTSSFDHTVKAWKVDPSGKTMQLAGTWPHKGIVNFVVTSHHEEEHFVATATDVADKAVRIYTVNPEKISSSACSTWGPMMAGVDPSAEPSAWAYYPATIQWGIAKNCSHHLLVGYSPRALGGDDDNIPETKRNTGEMRMINAKTQEMIPMGIPLCQNIFEVVWHPTRAVFIVAMTRGASKAEAEVRTQIRVFQYQPKPSSNAASAPFQPVSNGFAPHEEVPEEMYCFMMVLDCFSSDINELTLNPNSYEHFYATAACTDGKVYVWDTARGHRPIHVLSHGKPVDEYIDNREREDTGCKFTAWGSTPDRLYTGGSDGVVKVWDVKRPKHEPFLRDLLEVSGPVSSGAFSPDKSKLAIGDASGRVYLLSVDESDNVAEDTVKLPLAGGLYNTTALTRSVHRPKPYIPHPEPAPPPNHYPEEEDTDPDSGVLRGRNYLQRGQLYRHGNPVLGVFQGPNYGELGLYRREAHWDEDPSNPLLADAERNQQDNKLPSRSRRGGIGARISFGRGGRKIVLDDDDEEALQELQELHRSNRGRDLDWERLSEEVRDELVRGGVEPGVEEVGVLNFEDESEGSSEGEEERSEGSEGEEEGPEGSDEKGIVDGYTYKGSFSERTGENESEGVPEREEEEPVGSEDDEMAGVYTYEEFLGEGSGEDASMGGPEGAEEETRGLEEDIGGGYEGHFTELVGEFWGDGMSMSPY